MTETLEARKQASPESSYVAKLFSKGEDAILKKIGEEATEVILASKAGDKTDLVYETADLWFHCMVLLAQHGLSTEDVLNELARREGVSGISRKGWAIKGMSMSDCLFCKIVRAEIPCRKVYEDDEVMAFHDIHPVAPVHFMLVPKLHLATLDDARDTHAALLGKMLLLAPRLAKEQGLENGFRTVINTGKGGGQEIFHLHIHVIGGGIIPPMVRHD